MSMDFLFGSDLEDSDDEAKVDKQDKRSERDAQVDELFGDSPSEGEDEAEHGGPADSDSDREEADSGGEREEERKNSAQEGEEDDNEDDNEVRNGEFLS